MATTTNHVQVLKDIICVALDFRLWSGRRKLKAEDLRQNGQVIDLPPDALASLGSKKIMDPKEIAWGGTLKKRAERLLDETGVRFLGGWAIPLAKADEITGLLDAIVQEFDQERAKFLVEYDQLVNDWLAQFPEWGTILRGAITPEDEVNRRLYAGYQAFKVQPVASDADAGVNTGLVKEADGLADQLYLEVAKDSKDAWTKQFEGRAEIGQATLGVIRRLRDKLHGLSFLDMNVKAVVAEIDRVLGTLPSTGPIKGNDLAAIQGLVLLLSDQDRMKRHGAGLGATQTVPTVQVVQAAPVAPASAPAAQDAQASQPQAQADTQPQPQPAAETPAAAPAARKQKAKAPAKAPAPEKQPAPTPAAGIDALLGFDVGSLIGGKVAAVAKPGTSGPAPRTVVAF